MTKIKPISLDTLKKVGITNVLQDIFAIRETHVIPCPLPYSRYSYHPKNYKNQKHGNNTEGVRVDSTFRESQRNRVDK